MILTNPAVFDRDAFPRALELFLTATDQPAELAAQLRRRILYLYGSGELDLALVEAAGLAVRRAAACLEWESVRELAERYRSER
jgi:hypothetical protein